MDIEWYNLTGLILRESLKNNNNKEKSNFETFVCTGASSLVLIFYLSILFSGGGLSLGGSVGSGLGGTGAGGGGLGLNKGLLGGLNLAGTQSTVFFCFLFLVRTYFILSCFMCS